MTPVVLGAIEMRPRTHLAGLQVFLASLRAQSPDGRIVIFNRSPDHAPLTALLRQFAVEVVDAAAFDQQHRIPPVEVEIARFLAYRYWLDVNPVNRVILADVLDVAWQGDPETIPMGRGLQVFAEEVRIGACPYNSKWAREVWPEQHPALMDRPAVCCGVIAGDVDSIQAYLAFYAMQFRQRDRATIRRGFDSSILHGYVYFSPGQPVHPAVNPICMHLGYIPPEVVSEDGGTVWARGVAPTIVHQYNRHPEVMKGLRTRWI